jgi:hypothetical protein
MTVLIYVDTSKQVGDPTISRSLRMPTPRKHGSRKTIPKAWPSSRGNRAASVNPDLSQLSGLFRGLDHGKLNLIGEAGEMNSQPVEKLSLRRLRS